MYDLFLFYFMSAQGVVKWLDSAGVTSPRGKGWNKAEVLNILPHLPYVTGIKEVDGDRHLCDRLVDWYRFDRVQKKITALKALGAGIREALTLCCLVW